MGSQAQNDIEALKRKFEDMQLTVTNLDVTINNLIEEGIGKDELQALQDQIDIINTTLAGLSDDVDNAIKDSETVKQIQADLDEIKSYDPSVIPAMLEIILNADLENLPSKIQANADKIAALESDVAIVKSDVSDLKGRMDTAESNIDAIQTDIGDIKDSIDDINDKLTELSKPWVIKTDLTEPPTDATELQNLLDQLPTNGLLITKEEED